MKNLSLERQDICHILLAITSVKDAYMRELASDDITEMRRMVSESSLKMWEELHTNIKNQLQKQED